MYVEGGKVKEERQMVGIRHKIILSRRRDETFASKKAV
jgi:hypothetical protein